MLSQTHNLRILFQKSPEMLVHTRLIACCLKFIQCQAKLVVREVVLELHKFLSMALLKFKWVEILTFWGFRWV